MADDEQAGELNETPGAEKHIPSKKIACLSDLLAEVRRIRRIGEYVAPLIWFRGQANASWKLLPRLLRPESWVAHSSWIGQESSSDPNAIEAGGYSPVKPSELLVNNEFRRRAAAMLPNDSDEVGTYFLAQHHGLPTRLLDWTSNPLAALFFSVIERPNDDGEVVAIVVDRGLLAGYGTAHFETCSWNWIVPVMQHEDIVVQSVKAFFGHGTDQCLRAILPILPDLMHARLVQQDSCFTLHLPGCPLIQDDGKSLLRLSVPADKKKELLQELASAGVGWASLFPDLDHVANQIRLEFEIG